MLLFNPVPYKHPNRIKCTTCCLHHTTPHTQTYTARNGCGSFWIRLDVQIYEAVMYVFTTSWLPIFSLRMVVLRQRRKKPLHLAYDVFGANRTRALIAHTDPPARFCRRRKALLCRSIVWCERGAHQCIRNRRENMMRFLACRQSASNFSNASKGGLNTCSHVCVFVCARVCELREVMTQLAVRCVRTADICCVLDFIVFGSRGARAVLFVIYHSFVIYDVMFFPCVCVCARACLRCVLQC